MILLLLLLHLSVNRWSLFFVESSIVFGNQQRRERDFTVLIYIFVHYVNLSFEMFNCLFIKGKRMQSAFITLIECLWIFIMSQRITMNAQRIDSSGNSECNFVVQVCVRLQSEIYDACRHIMSFMCAKEWMNRWDIKDQGQCETNNIFRFF